MKVIKNFKMSFYQSFIFLSGSRFTSHDSLILQNEIATSPKTLLAMTEQKKPQIPLTPFLKGGTNFSFANS